MAGEEQTRSTATAESSIAPPSGGAPPLSLGDVVDGRYTIEAQLGEGTMGLVYRARERLLERPIAIKTIAPAWAHEPAFVQSFLEEARSMARIRHPNVVQLYTVGDLESAYYMAMEFVRGSSLDRILVNHVTRSERLSVHNVVALLNDIIKGVAAIHEAGLTHCDLKPANVVVEEQTGRPVIIDFGLATQAGPDEAAHRAGSPAYMSPERAAGGPATEQSDIYALGITAYELLVGELPYPARTREEVEAMHRDLPIPRMSDRFEELAAFEPVIHRAMQKHPDHRFTSCEEMGAALSEARERWGQQLPKGSGTMSAVFDPSEIRVLIVDDDPHFRRAASRAAKLVASDRRIRVLPASTGEQAVTIARRRMPALILLDYQLPELDGVATLSAVRSLPRGHDARVAVISGSVDEARWRFEALGVTDFLSKPVGVDALVDVVQRNVPPRRRPR
ncbi:MAG TPA: response regulator [Polyangiaceae bacterium]|nr:response regulator [Polyangiaceae bacterium]